MDVLTAMETCTTMRYLQGEAVPKADLEALIYAATRASNPGNSQGWSFLIIDDAHTKSVIGTKVLEGMKPVFENRPEATDRVEERMMLGAEHLTRNFGKVPAWVVCMARKVYPPHDPQESFMPVKRKPLDEVLVWNRF